MNKCSYCNGTGKYRQPKDKALFDSFVDREMDKAYYVNYAMAKEKAYEKIGFILVDCPYCNHQKA